MYACCMIKEGYVLTYTLLYYVVIVFCVGGSKTKQYCIFHKMSNVLYRKYSSVVNKHSAVLLISLKGNKTLYCYYFPYTYMDSHHFIYGLTKFPTTLNGYCLLLHDN